MPEVKEEKITETRKYEPTDEEQKLLTKWKARFKRAKEFRDPYQAKWLRMYMLYRAYQNKQNYAYNTRLMPPIAFEIVQTVVQQSAKHAFFPERSKMLSQSLYSHGMIW